VSEGPLCQVPTLADLLPPRHGFFRPFLEFPSKGREEMSPPLFFWIPYSPSYSYSLFYELFFVGFEYSSTVRQALARVLLLLLSMLLSRRFFFFFLVSLVPVNRLFLNLRGSMVSQGSVRVLNRGQFFFGLIPVLFPPHFAPLSSFDKPTILRVSSTPIGNADFSIQTLFSLPRKPFFLPCHFPLEPPPFTSCPF